MFVVELRKPAGLVDPMGENGNGDSEEDGVGTGSATRELHGIWKKFVMMVTFQTAPLSVGGRFRSGVARGDGHHKLTSTHFEVSK